jgi:hypothetical protein
LRTGEDNLSPIENIIQEVKEEIARLSQVLRLLEGTATTGKEISTKEHGTTDTQNISGGQEENRSGTAGTLGKNQGSKEGVVRYFEISGALAVSG